jgi:hypothetical protein
VSDQYLDSLPRTMLRTMICACQCFIPNSEVAFLQWGKNTTDFTDFWFGFFHHMQLRRSCIWNLFQSVKSV